MNPIDIHNPAGRHRGLRNLSRAFSTVGWLLSSSIFAHVLAIGLPDIPEGRLASLLPFVIAAFGLNTLPYILSFLAVAMFNKRPAGQILFCACNCVIVAGVQAVLIWGFYIQPDAQNGLLFMVTPIGHLIMLFLLASMCSFAAKEPQ